MSTVSIKGDKSKKKVISSLEGSHRHRNKNQQGDVIVTMIGLCCRSWENSPSQALQGQCHKLLIE